MYFIRSSGTSGAIRDLAEKTFTIGWLGLNSNCDVTDFELSHVCRRLPTMAILPTESGYNYCRSRGR